MKKTFTMLLAMLCGTVSLHAQDIPLVYSVENTGAEANPVPQRKTRRRKSTLCPTHWNGRTAVAA